MSRQYPTPPQYPTIQKFETPEGPVYISDDYTWMQDVNAPETIAYITDENRLTAEYMAADPLADELTARIEALNRMTTVHTTPEVHGSKHIWMQRSPGQERGVLMISGEAGADPEVVVDPNALGEHVSLRWHSVPEKGEYIAYALQRKGNGRLEVHVRNTRTGEDRVFASTRMMELAWDDEGAGFLYSKSNSQAHGSKDPTTHQQVYYHQADGAQEDRLLVDAVEQGLGADAWLAPKSMTEAHALVDVFYAKTNIKPLLVDLRTGQAEQLAEHEDAAHRSFLLDGYLYTVTAHDANNRRVLRTPAEDADRSLAAWEPFIPEDADRVIRNVAITKDHFVVEYSQNVASQIELRSRHTGAPERLVSIPGLWSVKQLATATDRPDFYVKIGTYLSEGMIYQYDGQTATRVWSDNRSLDPKEYEVVQEEFESLDGTAIPVVFVCRNGLLRQPGIHKAVLQEQYAGFANGRHPDKIFSNMLRVWLEYAGIVAEPSNRGGDEFGDRWHTAAIGPDKERSIDDSIACASYMKTTGIADKIGVSGGSNGGLIALAALLRAPELIDAGDIRVPLTDMLNYTHYSSAAKRWRPEFGDATVPAQFGWLARYSPYHTSKPGMKYNAFFTVGINDKVVHPVHSLKMVARLQRTGSHVLLHVDGAAGHGPDRGASQLARIQGMRLAYLMRELGLVETP